MIFKGTNPLAQRKWHTNNGAEMHRFDQSGHFLGMHFTEFTFTTKIEELPVLRRSLLGKKIESWKAVGQVEADPEWAVEELEPANV